MWRSNFSITFRRYGLPRRMLMDNGPPWGGEPDFYTELTLWLLRLGVQVSHGRPRHPQTQGKDERFHRTFRAEGSRPADLQQRVGLPGAVRTLAARL